MKKFMKNHLTLLPFYAVVLFSVIWVIFFYKEGLDRIFITSDQQGYRYYEKKEYAKAAQTFENLSYKGASYYRDAAFKKSSSMYQNLSSKEEKFNLGNSFVMSGEYNVAIEAYEQALKIDKNFKAAQENLVLAKARKSIKEPENSGDQGVGLGEDDTVFDNQEGKGKDDDSSPQQDMEPVNPNWLDRLQTGPKEFLKNKFSYQHQMNERNDVK